MRSLLALAASVIALSGCVTENSYEGNDKPVVENTINNTGAARTRIALALEYLNTGNSSQAKYNLERAASFAPNLPEVHYSFAYYYQQVGEDSLADDAYQKALKINPNDPNTRNNYGVFLCGINEYDRATEQFIKAIEIPSYIRVAESYENLALCAIEFNDFEQAEKYFLSAIKHSSMRASSIISLSALYYAKSDLHKAQELLTRFEKSGQVSPRSLLLNYLIDQRMGHIEKAEATAATILQTYPVSNEAVLIREQRLKQSEFEILRFKYRQAKLDEFKSENSTVMVNANPKMRIVKKKKAPQFAAAKVELATEPTQTTQKDSSTRKAELETASVTNTQSNSEESQIQQTNEAILIPANINIDNTPIDTKAVMGALTTVATTATLTTQASEPVLAKTNSNAQAVFSALSVADLNNENPAPTPSTDGFFTSKVETLGVSAATPTKPNVPESTRSTNEPKDGVKIVSFGAPKTEQMLSAQTDVKATQPRQNDAQSVGEQVEFYQPVKNAAVFASRNNRQATVQFNTIDPIDEAPLLNSRLSPPAIPFHILQAGENLFSISVRYNVRLQKLLQWNGLRESDRLVNGTKIYLNDPNIFYKINAGDTLYSIATERRLLIDQLMRWNKLSPDIALKPGHRLLLVDPESYAL
ncbi:type IV pilus biogenesis/stability protein PilW [Pseudoalteromonas atlantica]|uniref:type IV pilus biogenesis/stability protein PilW n=1 Tax=Pseudoalteromonas atlantica TaxID=288 RepID=UPI0037359B7D